MMRLFLLFITLLFLITTFSEAQIEFTIYCPRPSSCGDVKIRYPFRLKTDPFSCGSRHFELECDTKNNILIFPNSNSQEYHVKSIDYKNTRIELLNPGITRTTNQCTLFFPVNSIPKAEFPKYYSSWDEGLNGYISSPVVLVSCPRRVNSTMYVGGSTSSTTYCYRNNTASTSNDNAYSYALLGRTARVSDLDESCKIDFVGWVSNDELPGSLLLLRNNTSFSTILDAMANGFPLNWSGPGVLGLCDLSKPICRSLLFILYIVSVFIAAAEYVIIPARLFFGVPCLIILIIYKCRRRHLSAYDNIEDFLQGQNNFVAVRYSYSDIKKITNNFKEKLGEGGFGYVFKGKLRSGIFVAVKMMNKSKASGKDFMNEVATIGRIHHVNVVQLIGFSVEGPKRALLYEFMPNGSLEKYIFPQEDKLMSLSYEKIFEISLGVARGIDYLHKGCDMQILHFDIKPHNILLDENFAPKISDFGLAKLHSAEDSMVSLTAARGTMGYMAPELFYKNIGRVSYKADVYSYGMLLMEMAGRRKNLNPFVENLSQIYFPTWVYDQINKGKDTCITDVCEEEESKMLKKMVLVALGCIQMAPVDRPSMNKIVEMLEGDEEALEMPPKPFLYPGGEFPNEVDAHENERPFLSK